MFNMRKKIVYHEEQKLGFEFHGSKSRCSISSKRFVLLDNGKKKGRKRLGTIFKSLGKWVLKIMDFILILGTIIEFALLIKNYFGW